MDILYQDNRIAVCLKPPGVLSTDEPGGMPSLLRAALGTDCVRTVHRLDAAVGGVMVFARSRMAASILSEQIREHRFQKEYLAVVHGMLPAEGRMQDFLLRDRCDGLTRVAEAGTPGSKEARLSYRVLARLLSPFWPLFWPCVPHAGRSSGSSPSSGTGRTRRDR